MSLAAVNKIWVKCSIAVTVFGGIKIEGGDSGNGNLPRVSALPCLLPDLNLMEYSERDAHLCIWTEAITGYIHWKYDQWKSKTSATDVLVHGACQYWKWLWGLPGLVTLIFTKKLYTKPPGKDSPGFCLHVLNWKHLKVSAFCGLSLWSQDRQRNRYLEN